MTSRYLDLEPKEIETAVHADLEAALTKRQVRVEHDGRPGRPDIVLEGPDFAIVVEVAKRTGASAASEFPALKDHRDLVERELEKPTHLLFTCVRTPDRFIRHIRDENAGREEAGAAGRFLFLSLEDLGRALGLLRTSPAALYPFERWAEWFAEWKEVGNDIAALERFYNAVLHENAELRAEVADRVEGYRQAAQERLRKDIQALEDKLRHRGIVKENAHRALIYLMFVKLYEEKREERGKPSRFTAQGFVNYKDKLPPADKAAFKDRTLHHLVERDIAFDDEIKASGILDGYTFPDSLRDEFVQQEMLPVLDRYRVRGTLLDALGAVFEALARRGEKDVRIGQFFTPEPIVRFAVDVAQPGPTETVLDPAAGTGRFLVTAMEQMEGQADEVPGQTREAVLDAIHSERILGTDADEWISRIARMNMYIHGDGKSNIRQENGLFLADLQVFPGLPTNLEGAVDVCLTNPPLGDMDYRTYARDLAERTPGLNPDDWVKRRLPLLPGRYKEEAVIPAAEAGIAKWKETVREAIQAGDAKGEQRAERYRAQYEKKLAEAKASLAAGTGTWTVSGNSAKGSALFIAAIRNYLRAQRDPKAPEEWRGGRLAIVIDEAVLNAPEYRETRRYIAQHYFIKAIFSFGRDAFWFHARTTAKTSLMYAYVKPDPEVVQREPIFFCHIEKLGFTRTGKSERSDLARYLVAYKEFEGAVRGSYSGGHFDEAAARDVVAGLAHPLTMRVRWAGDVADAGDRLDQAYEAARQIRVALPPDHPKLGDYVEVQVRIPEEDPMGVYSFATVDRRTGTVTILKTVATSYSVNALREIRAGDIVLSGMDLVNGAVGYARENVDGHVVSHEFYVLRVRQDKEEEVDPRFLALLLRTMRMRDLVSGTVTGTSNRTRIENEGTLLALPLPTLPDLASQKEVANEVDTAMRAHEGALRALRASVEHANRIWGLPDLGDEADSDDEAPHDAMPAGDERHEVSADGAEDEEAGG